MTPVNVEWELKQLADAPAELPETVRRRIDQTLASLPARPRRRWMRGLSYGGAAAATACSLVIGSAFVLPEAAAALREAPVIGSVFRLAGDYGLKLADEKGLSTAVNRKVTDSGITVEVTEVMYDGSRVSVGYVQQTDGAIGELARGIEFRIDGKRYDGSSSGTGSYVDDHTYAGVIDLTPSKELPDRFELQMNVTRIGETAGTWSFEMPARKTESTNKAVMPMLTKTDGDITLTVKKLLFTPSSVSLDVDYKMPAAMSSRVMQFRLVDDRGIELQSRSGGGGGHKDDRWSVNSFTQQFSPLGRIPKSVTLLAYFDGPTAGAEQLRETQAVMEQPPTPEQPLVLPQGPAGRLKITQVERMPDKFLVHYETEGLMPHEQSNPLWLVDANGGKVLQLKKPAVTVDPDRYSFIREFPPVAGDKLTFGTREFSRRPTLQGWR